MRPDRPSPPGRARCEDEIESLFTVQECLPPLPGFASVRTESCVMNSGGDATASREVGAMENRAARVAPRDGPRSGGNGLAPPRPAPNGAKRDGDLINCRFPTRPSHPPGRNAQCARDASESRRADWRAVTQSPRPACPIGGRGDAEAAACTPDWRAMTQKRRAFSLVFLPLVAAVFEPVPSAVTRGLTGQARGRDSLAVGAQGAAGGGGSSW